MQQDIRPFALARAARCCLVLTGILLLSLPVVAQTEVSGTITEATWTLEGSPYMVVGDILVAGLEVEPGTAVLFTGDFEFEIAGVLSAVGTEQDSIRFAPVDTTVSWQGLFFNFSSPGSELAYFTVEGASSSGIRIDNSAPILRDCRIANNSSTADNAGGGLTANSEVTVTDCVIELNTATRFGAGVHSSGPLTLVRTLIRGNTIDRALSTTPVAGGGIYATGDLTLINCLIEGNLARSINGSPFQSATAMGGGLYVEANSLAVRNSIIRANRAHAGANTAAEVALGGGIYFEGGSAAIVNTIVSGNTLGTRLVWSGSAAQGGGVRIGAGSVDIQNSTLAYNDFDGLWAAVGAGAAVTNSILYFNAADEERDSDPAQVVGEAAVTYSDVQAGSEGEGNIDLNPLFSSDTDLTIVVGSPAIDSGNSGSVFEDGCLPPGLGAARNDMGAHGGPGNCGWIDTLPVGAGDSPEGQRTEFELYGTYPNPSTGVATLAFNLLEPAAVRLHVFDVLGREVAAVAEQLPVGEHRMVWHADELASGVYLYRVEARLPGGTEVRSGLLTLLK